MAHPSSRQLLYYDADYNDRTLATYITNYCYAALLLMDAYYLLKSRPYKFNIRDRYYSCGLYFIFVAISNILAGITHQVFPVNADTSDEPIIYWIMWSLGMISFSVGTFFFWIMIGPIWELNKGGFCMNRLGDSRSYITYFGFCIILFALTLIWDFMVWESQLNIAILLLGCVYLIFYSIVDGSQNHCKYASIIWLYLLYGIIMIGSAVITQYIYNDGCKMNDDEYHAYDQREQMDEGVGFTQFSGLSVYYGCPFDDKFNNNAIWNICQMWSCIVLFAGVVYEEYRKHIKRGNSIHDRAIVMQNTPNAPPLPSGPQINNLPAFNIHVDEDLYISETEIGSD